MKKFTEQKFKIPKLKGISEKNIEEHLKLYSGYVKHANLIQDHIEQLSADGDLPAQAGKYAYELAELSRRFSFEYGGIRNHEFYFRAFEGGATPPFENSPLVKALGKEWGSFEKWLARFKATALIRGIGWAKLVYDQTDDRLLTFWHDEQHLGQLPDTRTILALDMWEHSYVADYQPSGKKQYVEDFFENLNWSVAEKNFTEARSEK